MLLLFISAAMILFGISGWWSVPLSLAGLGFVIALARPLGAFWQSVQLIASMIAVVLMLAFILMFIYFSVTLL